jgi:uncharacterized protein (DUF433 family)
MTINRVKVEAKLVLRDIKAGIADVAIMEKYGLSAIGLKSLFRKLAEMGLIRHLDAREVISDLRSGMSDTELMFKYNLSDKGLQKLFAEIDRLGLSTGAAKPDDLPETAPMRVKEIAKVVRSVKSRDRKRAQTLLADVKAGLTDDALQEKYDLSRERFYVFKAAALDFIAKERERLGEPARKVIGKRFIDDIRSGMDDQSLMVKYDLTPRELQVCFRQIIKWDLMGPLELGKRLAITTSQVREAFVEMGKAVRELN